MPTNDDAHSAVPRAVSEYEAKRMERLEQIRRSHASARPKSENPAWVNTHNDLDHVLALYADLERKTNAMERERDEMLAALEALTAACEAVNDGYYPTDAMALAALARQKGEGK